MDFTLGLYILWIIASGITTVSGCSAKHKGGGDYKADFSHLDNLDASKHPTLREKIKEVVKEHYGKGYGMSGWKEPPKSAHHWAGGGNGIEHHPDIPHTNEWEGYRGGGGGGFRGGPPPGHSGPSNSGYHHQVIEHGYPSHGPGGPGPEGPPDYGGGLFGAYNEQKPHVVLGPERNRKPHPSALHNLEEDDYRDVLSGY